MITGKDNTQSIEEDFTFPLDNKVDGTHHSDKRRTIM